MRRFARSSAKRKYGADTFMLQAGIYRTLMSLWLVIATPLTLCAAPSVCCDSSGCLCLPDAVSGCCESTTTSVKTCCPANHVNTSTQKSGATLRGSGCACSQESFSPVSKVHLRCDLGNTDDADQHKCSCRAGGMPVSPRLDCVKTDEHKQVDELLLLQEDVSFVDVLLQPQPFRWQEVKRSQPTDVSLCVLNCVWRE